MGERKTVSQCLTSDYCKGWNDAVDAQPKWISVENPPKEDGEYIVIAITHADEIIKTWDIFESNDGWCGDLGEFKKVLYYMPFDSLVEPKEVETWAKMELCPGGIRSGEEA